MLRKEIKLMVLYIKKKKKREKKRERESYDMRISWWSGRLGRYNIIRCQSPGMINIKFFKRFHQK